MLYEVITADLCLPEGVREQIKMVFEQSMAGEIEMFEYHENPVLTRSGEQRLVAWYNTVLHDEDGSIVGTLSSGEDITERNPSRAGWNPKSSLIDNTSC